MTKNVRIELISNGESFDISHLLVAQSLSISEHFCNDDYKSVLNTATWSIFFDKTIYFMLRDASEPLQVFISDDYGECLFTGVMEPVLNGSWITTDFPENLVLEAVDFTEILDRKLAQSVSFPAEVEGVPFWIFKRDNDSMSILYRLLELAGLSRHIAPDAPDIPISVLYFSATQDSKTYREMIDSLLSDYQYVLFSTSGNMVTWGKVAYSAIETVETIDEDDIDIGRSKFEIVKRYDVHDGVKINWPKTKVMRDALLWRGSLPTGDTENPTPGEAIAVGDYWPEDSDIVETWMDFKSTFLDVAYLEGKSRLKNDSLALIASSSHYLKDIKDAGITLDDIQPGVSIVYESLRARLRYKNTTQDIKKLYWSEIYGKALVQTSRPEPKYPETAQNPSSYPAEHIYDSLSAKALVEARWMMLSKGCWKINIFSSRELLPGQVIHLMQSDEHWDGYAIVVNRKHTFNFSDVWEYSLVSTAPIQSVTPKTTAVFRSGLPAPAQNGNSPRLIYTRAAAKPATPIGVNPEGWTTGMPEGTAPLWMSSGTFASTGDQVGSWTEPVRVSGIDKGAYRGYGATDPADAADGDFYIFIGATTAERIKYHFYRYSAASDLWTETQDSASVMAGWKDALQLAKDTGEVIFAAMLVVDILIANKLAVGGGTLSAGLLFRVMDDDGNGNVVIEARFNGNKVWWINVDTGRMYGNFAEIRNVLPYQYEDSLDATHPFEIDFFIPSDTVKIVSIKLSAKGLKYRAYSTSLAFDGIFDSSTGSATPAITIQTDNFGTTGSAGGHGHTYDAPTGAQSGGSHKHGVTESFWGMETTEAGAHTHSLNYGYNNGSTNSVNNHTHSIPRITGVSQASHNHSFNFNHSHNVIFGIFEGTTPSSVSLFCDNGAGYGSAISLGSNEILASELNLSSYFSGTGWKRLKFTSARLGRIIANLILQVDITA